MAGWLGRGGKKRKGETRHTNPSLLLAPLPRRGPTPVYKTVSSGKKLQNLVVHTSRVLTTISFMQKYTSRVCKYRLIVSPKRIIVHSAVYFKAGN